MCRSCRIRACVSRSDLVKVLGGKCVDCWSKGSKRYPLEIDHPNGRSYESRKVDSVRRTAIYWKEYEGGVKLEVRCRRCNANAHKINGMSVLSSLELEF